MNLVVYFWLNLKASLFSTGGMGNLPSLHHDLLGRHWATEQQFGEALAVGQVSPGPNGLWVVCMGYLVAGLGGALIAAVAISLPPLLVLGVNHLYRRAEAHPAMEGFTRGLSLAVVGIFVIVMGQLLWNAGLDAGTGAITLAAVGLGWSRRVPVLLVLVLAGIVAVLLYGGRPG